MFILKTLFDKDCSKSGGRLYACFVDFRKAFDSVIHDGLRFKLLQIGIGTKFYNIIKSMYNGSQSCVDLNIFYCFNIYMYKQKGRATSSFNISYGPS